jgi:chromosome-anchoring protein RacA
MRVSKLSLNGFYTYVKVEGLELNTNEVAKLLGVSISTVQRWVKQLKLPMEKNDRGHYLFKEEDIELLKDIHQQIQQGVLLSDIAPHYEKKARIGVVKECSSDPAIENLSSKMKELETKLNDKADSVTTYQLLQHRREIEELQIQIKTLTNKISLLEKQLSPEHDDEKPLPTEKANKERKTKKKNFVSHLFGF